MWKLWIMVMAIVLIPSALAQDNSPETVTFESPTLTFQYPAALADEIEVTRRTELNIPDSGSVDYNVFTLSGYENITRENYPTQPYLTVYPISAPGLTESGQAYINDEVQRLQTLLTEQPDPFQTEIWIPSLNAHSMPTLFIAQVEYLDFVNGRGVRHITQTAMGPDPVANDVIYYHFRGLTHDGQYWINASFPVDHVLLPETLEDTEIIMQSDKLREFYDDYTESVGVLLNISSARAFSPDLDLLDALITSIEVHGGLTEPTPPVETATPTMRG